MSGGWRVGRVHLRPEPPACPLLVSPADLAVVETSGSVLLDWSAAVDADSYRVYVDNVLIATVVAPTTQYTATGLNPNHITYTWSVRAVNQDGESGGCGSRAFTTTPVVASIQWESATYNGGLFDASITLVATRTGNTDTTVTADYSFNDIEAVADFDFDGTPGTVTFNPGQVSKDVVVQLFAPDYDAEVLARSPDLYCRMDDPSPTTSFPDLSGFGHNLVLTGGSVVTYQDDDLLIDPGGSFGRDDAGTNFRLRYAYGTPTNVPGIGEDDPCTAMGWAYINNNELDNVKTLCHFGGSSGGGQFFKMWWWWVGDGTFRVGWHQRINGVPSGFTSALVPVTLPVATPFWFNAGCDPANSRFFFKLNADATVYVPFGTGVSILQRPDATSSIAFIGRQNGNNGDPLDGLLARAEFHLAAVEADMWTRWHLGVTRSFEAVLSNPSTDAVLGAPSTTTVTLS